MKIRGRALLFCLSLALFGTSAQAAAQTVDGFSGDPETRLATPATPILSPRVFKDLVQESVRDFRRLPSSETATWLAIGAAAALVGHRMDQPTTAAFSVSALDKPFDAGDMIGKTRVQLGGAFATYALGRITGQPRVAAVGADLLRAQLITKTLTTALKVSIGRDRPDGTQWSFPSGHTSASFATATVLQQHFGWKAGVPAYGLATYVAASRIQERRHFLSDVVFGAAIGMVAGRTVTVGHGKGRFALAPVAAPGGAGVAFTWVGN